MQKIHHSNDKDIKYINQNANQNTNYGNQNNLNQKNMPHKTPKNVSPILIYDVFHILRIFLAYS